MPSQPDRQQYIDNILGDVAQAYFQSPTNFIASRVFPVVPVDKQVSKYYVFNKNDLLRDEMQRRPNASESSGGGFNLSTDEYRCDVFASHIDITERDRKNWNVPSTTLDEASTQVLVQRGMQKMEAQWVSDFFTTSVWGTDSTPSATWDVYATSDPLADVDTGKTTVLTNTGFEPNTLVLGYQVWQKLKRHPLIVDRVSGGSTTANPAQVSQAAVAAILEVEKLYVAKAVKATNKQGETAGYGLHHGKHALLCYVPASPSLVTPSAGYTFMWNIDTVGDTIQIARVPMPQLGLGTERLEIEKSWDNKVTGSDLGYFFNGAVA